MEIKLSALPTPSPEVKTPIVAYPLPAPESSRSSQPITDWSLEMLMIPPELAEEAHDVVQSMHDLLNPAIAKLFAIPITISKPQAGRPSGEPQAGRPSGEPQAGRPSGEPSIPPLHGQPLVMRSRSELIGHMAQIVTSLLEPELTLTPNHPITEETAPGLLLTWMYLNGFISDHLILQLQDGPWGRALLAQPYDCIWTLEWCRYFAIDEEETFFKSIERRLTDSLGELISQAHVQFDKLADSGRPQPIDIMANWSPSQKQAIVDGYRRYYDRCLANGSDFIGIVTLQLWTIQQPWHKELTMPFELQLAVEYYNNGSCELADRLYRAMMMRHVPTPEERKWFTRYIEAQGRPQYYGSTLLAAELIGPQVSVIEAMANYLSMPLPERLQLAKQATLKRLGMPPDGKLEIIGRPQLDFHCESSLSPGFIMPYVPIGVDWPSDQELSELRASKSKATIEKLSHQQLLGYLVALVGIRSLHAYEPLTVHDLRLVLTREIKKLNKANPAAGPVMPQPGDNE